jgi:hypothetical protein
LGEIVALLSAYVLECEAAVRGADEPEAQAAAQAAQAQAEAAAARAAAEAEARAEVGLYCQCWPSLAAKADLCSRVCSGVYGKDMQVSREVQKARWARWQSEKGQFGAGSTEVPDRTEMSVECAWLAPQVCGLCCCTRIGYPTTAKYAVKAVPADTVSKCREIRQHVQAAHVREGHNRPWCMCPCL